MISAAATPLAAVRHSMPRPPADATPAGTAAELLCGLQSPLPRIPPKFLYDALGCRLFELITALPEYYVARTEHDLLARNAEAIAEAAGVGGTLIDLGAGNCAKARTLLPALHPSAYVAVDVSTEFVDLALATIGRDFPGLRTRAVRADLADDFDVPDLPAARRLFFYSGSSIGNFDPEAALALLARLRRHCADGGALLIGVDLIKELPVLDAAYNDALGITAAFNRNVLNHVNAVLGSDFDTREWRHHAFYNCARSRIEMHLVAEAEVTVSWPDGSRRFLAGESIHTESSYKYRLEDFRALLARAGFASVRHWTDERGWFAVCLAHA